ncbi:nucleotide exchange factor GrpE [Gordonia sp. PP30]|nr:nucleotide exchange factor GrpE [Gordonia sp. PP30]UQE76562.1 nucleotide exchange factor GrpE [Gordonia sp. PP30]
MAAFTAFVQQMDARFGAVHEALTATVTGLEQNLEQSLAELRAREAAARGEVSRDLLRPLAQRFAMLVDRIELAIDRREEDPCDPWLLSQTAVDEALEILEEFGIDDIDAEPGSEVDRSRHRVVKMGNEKGEATDTSRIVERRRRGLMVDGYVVRPAEVVAEWVSADSGDED